MFIYVKSSENSLADTDGFYEARASQEELYLEEAEEELRMILESDDSSPSCGQNLEEQQKRAAEALITGDSDEPPLSDAAVEEMLRGL